MGYPMTYQRVIMRNRLLGDYGHPGQEPPMRPELAMLIGDLRRLESDQRDAAHCSAYAKIAGISPDQARSVLDAFFDGYGAM